MAVLGSGVWWLAYQQPQVRSDLKLESLARQADTSILRAELKAEMKEVKAEVRASCGLRVCWAFSVSPAVH